MGWILISFDRLTWLQGCPFLETLQKIQKLCTTTSECTVQVFCSLWVSISHYFLFRKLHLLYMEIFQGCIVYVGVKFVNKFATVALLCVIFSIIAVYTGIFTNIHGNDKLRWVEIKNLLIFTKNYSKLEITKIFCSTNFHNKIFPACVCLESDCSKISKSITALKKSMVFYGTISVKLLTKPTSFWILRYWKTLKNTS